MFACSLYSVFLKLFCKCDALLDLVAFVQFFKNCTNATKSCNAPQISIDLSLFTCYIAIYYLLYCLF